MSAAPVKAPVKPSAAGVTRLADRRGGAPTADGGEARPDNAALLVMAGAPFKVRRRDVERLLACRSTRLDRYIAEGDIPRPHSNGANDSWWWSDALHDALQRLRDRDREQGEG